MKIKMYKKTNKLYENIYTQEKETKEIEIKLDNGCIIRVSEHQLGQTLDKPHFDIICKNGCYGMNIDTFIEKVNS